MATQTHIIYSFRKQSVKSVVGAVRQHWPPSLPLPQAFAGDHDVPQGPLGDARGLVSGAAAGGQRSGAVVGELGFLEACSCSQ